MRIPHVGSRILGLYYWGAWSEDGPREGEGSHVMADTEITPRCPDVPGPSELLQKIHQRLQLASNAAHEVVDKRQDGEEISVGRESEEGVQILEGCLYHRTNPQSLRSDLPHSVEGGCLRLCAERCGLPEDARWSSPPYCIPQLEVQPRRAE